MVSSAFNEHTLNNDTHTNKHCSPEDVGLLTYNTLFTVNHYILN